MNSESGASPAEVPGGGPTEERPNRGIMLRVAQSGEMSFSTTETQQTATAGLDPWFEDSADFPARESGHTTATSEAAWQGRARNAFVALGFGGGYEVSLPALSEQTRSA